MDSYRSRVSHLTSILQQQNEVPLWALNNEKLIYQIAMGEKITRSPKRQFLFSLLQRAYLFRITDLFLMLCGAYTIVKIWVGAKKHPPAYREEYQRVFACCGCLPDDYFFSEYKTRSQAEVLKINWVTYEGLSSLKLPNLLRITDLFLMLCGAYTILKIWFGAKKKPPAYREEYQQVFACCGCLPDDYFFSEYKTRSQAEVLKINWVTYEGLSSLKLPNVLRLFISLIKHAHGHTKKLTKSQKEITDYLFDFLTVSATNIGTYVFYCKYWAIAKKMKIKELAILVPGIPAFAAIDVELKTVFIQHGLFALSALVSPQFHRIEAFTLDDVKYFRNSLKNDVAFYCNNQKLQKLNNNKVVLWISTDQICPTLQRNIESWHDIEEWCNQYGFKIVIRPTPKVEQCKLLELQSIFPKATLDDINHSFEASLKKWQPQFVIGWNSTALVTALMNNCIPISLYRKSSELYMCYTVYPLKERVLFWKEDFEKIDIATRSHTEYSIVLNQLKTFEININ